MSEAFLSSLLDELKTLKSENAKLKEKIALLESGNAKQFSSETNVPIKENTKDGVDSSIELATDMLIKYVKVLHI